MTADRSVAKSRPVNQAGTRTGPRPSLAIRLALGLAMSLIVAIATSCDGNQITSGQVLAGIEVPAAALEAGRRIYLRNCAPCHGVDGDGHGPAALASWPKPRNFTLAKFKFAGVDGQGLPSDDDLMRIIQNGLPGSSMPAWDLPTSELLDVIDYIKTLSPPGRGFRDPKRHVSKPEIPPLPLGASTTDPQGLADLIAEGERIYHEVFQCAKCHPAYVPPGRYSGLRGRNPELPAAKWSDDYNEVLLPPDFRRHSLRSVRMDASGANPQDLFRVVAYGLSGPMPGYRHLGDERVWAVVYYVKSLLDEDLNPR